MMAIYSEELQKKDKTKGKGSNASKKTVHRYVQIASYLRREINQRVYAPNEPLPGQRDLAKRFNTSFMTVGQALNQLTEEGIVRRIPRQGTFVNDPATTSQGIVGILTSIGTRDFSKYFTPVEAKLRDARFRALIFGGAGDYVAEEQAFREMGKFKERGLIIYSYYADQFTERIADLVAGGIACVAMYRPIKGIDSVRPDSKQAGALQAEHAARLGARKIIYIGYESQEYGRLQTEGLVERAKALGLSSLEDGIRLIQSELGAAGEREIHRRIKQIINTEFKNGDYPDTLIVYGDSYLHTACQVLTKKGIRPGIDVNLIGDADCHIPNLSYATTNEKIDEITSKAVQMLLERINGVYAGPARTVLVQPEPVIHE